ncbi:Receptor expression-enhancing protein 4 [Cladobotryum mycophilum]|uniref:Protein YOP1 n=1 Tax=Cladobotryum mycophilum TaxID=491253 RepID=A0ABR0ST19_9HYPO
MFDLFAMLLSSIASFLFPIFASYKALKTSDPAQLTPWLMYWVVFSCALLAESWVYFIVSWVPFYGYIRLFFFLYLILPQTQGARVLYEEYIHPFLRENEGQIDDFIASAHDRLKAAGITYVRRAIDYLRTQILGLPPTEHDPPPPPTAAAAAQGYTSALLARFNIPTAASSAAGSVGSEFYNLLAGAVSAATGAAVRGEHGGSAAPVHSASVIPAHLQDSRERMTFIAAQRDRLNILLTALDREAAQLQGGNSRSISRPRSGHESEEEITQRPPSGLSMWSGISKSRSETDFEKIDVDSGTEDDGTIRRRNAGTEDGGASWMPWGRNPDTGKTSGRED